MLSFTNQDFSNFLNINLWDEWEEPGNLLYEA